MTLERSMVLNKYNRLITRLYAACENMDTWPEEPILIDTDAMSELCETVFIEEGLLEIKDND